MRLTNKHNLPEPIVEAVRRDPYDKGGSDYSVTELIGPPRKAILEALHDHEIEEDASERIWSLLGGAVHGILERANQTGIAERRLKMTIEGKTVSGAQDLVCAARILTDYKVTTAWKFKNGQVPIEFEQQINSYAAILRANGEEISGGQIVGILRDWSKLEARRDPAYPQIQVIQLPVRLWAPEAAVEFLRARVLVHEAAKKILPECTPEERWARPTVYALMKKGRKTAVKLYDNEKDAKQHASTAPIELYVQTRMGESIRCAAYCSVSKFCTQFNQQHLKQVQEIEEVIA